MRILCSIMQIRHDNIGYFCITLKESIKKITQTIQFRGWTGPQEKVINDVTKLVKQKQKKIVLGEKERKYSRCSIFVSTAALDINFVLIQ